MILSDLRLCERELEGRIWWCYVIRDFVAPVPMYLHKGAKGTAPTTLRVLNSWKFNVLLPPV